LTGSYLTSFKEVVLAIIITILTNSLKLTTIFCINYIFQVIFISSIYRNFCNFKNQDVVRGPYKEHFVTSALCPSSN